MVGSTHANNAHTRVRMRAPVQLRLDEAHEKREGDENERSDHHRRIDRCGVVSLHEIRVERPTEIVAGGRRIVCGCIS